MYKKIFIHRYNNYSHEVKPLAATPAFLLSLLFMKKRININWLTLFLFLGSIMTIKI